MPVQALPLAAALGLNGDDVPLWARRLLTLPLQQWALDRWDPGSGVFEYEPGDHLNMGSTYSKGRTVRTRDLAPGMALEVLASLAADAAGGTKMRPSSARSVVRAIQDQAGCFLLELDDTRIAHVVGIVVRRWRARLTIMNADPESEWDRDEIRLAVVKPGAPNLVLRVGDITQPWLRDLLVNLLRVRIHHLAVRSAASWVLSVGRLSRFLATRTDAGSAPRLLSTAAMDRFVAALRADRDVTSVMHEGTVAGVGAVLSQARALGLVDRHGLPAGFTVHHGHYPDKKQMVREDRAFPDATFRFLLGADDLLGPRVLELARSIPGGTFRGEVFVTALHLAASFGRRPEELCSLLAHRVRVADAGAGELLYTNFKSGRDQVWLPVDARTAAFVQDWIPRLRGRYPDTPFAALALLPAPHANPAGVRPMRSVILAAWFRLWVTLLEQAIVLAHLHQATAGLPLEALCELPCRALAGQTLHVADEEHVLPAPTAQILIDYLADATARAAGSKYAPADLSDLPMFPDPFTPPRPNPLRGRRPMEFVSVSAARFKPLGEGWLPLAAGYPSGGIPGVNLGATRINPDQLQVRLFRHTYLQHLVNLGTDIFLVQELADHGNVQTTINSYVRVQDEKLREAVDLLATHRLNTYGRPATNGVALASAPARDMTTNDCTNPQVLALGREGCQYDRMCFGCDHFAADPSYIPDIKTEIHTCTMTLARLEIEEETALKPHHVAVLAARRDGWRRMLSVLTGHLDALDPAERERVETAADIVRDFRSRIRSGGLNLAGTTTLPTTARP
nr:hypothetical protein Ade03nite_25260 [Actinoplanes derwentensis]